jgi:hypothetical protein
MNEKVSESDMRQLHIPAKVREKYDFLQVIQFFIIGLWLLHYMMQTANQDFHACVLHVF